MDPSLFVILGILGYLLAGLATARVMWQVKHETVNGPRDTAAILIGWPVVLMVIAATYALDGVHQLVTRPTDAERLEHQHAVLQRRIWQLERDLSMGEQDNTPSPVDGAMVDPPVKGAG